MDDGNKLVAIREHLRTVLQLNEEYQKENGESLELKQLETDVRNALRALKEHGDAGDWVG